MLSQTVNNREFIDHWVILNHKHNILGLLYSIEVGYQINLTEEFDFLCSFEFINLLSDRFLESLVGDFRVFRVGDGVYYTVIASLAVEHTEGLVNIDDIYNLLISHELLHECIIASIALKGELIITHDLKLIDGIRVVLAINIDRYKFYIRHL